MQTEQEKFMKAALKLAQKSAEEGEVPVGCVIVCDGKIVGRGRNRRETKILPSLMQRLRRLAKRVKNWAAGGCINAICM